MRTCAPERLQIQTARPMLLLAKLNAAGVVLLGEHAPAVLADYFGGVERALPTSAAARFSSGLSVLDYANRTSVI